jgi:hypothetical protein
MSNEKDSTKKQKSTNQVSHLSALDKIVPKFCTNIDFQLLTNKNVVMSLSFKEGSNPQVLIDRVMIDYGHAKVLSRVLNELIEKAEKDD